MLISILLQMSDSQKELDELLKSMLSDSPADQKAAGPEVSPMQKHYHNSIILVSDTEGDGDIWTY